MKEKIFLIPGSKFVKPNATTRKNTFKKVFLNSLNLQTLKANFENRIKPLLSLTRFWVFRKFQSDSIDFCQDRIFKIPVG